MPRQPSPQSRRLAAEPLEPRRLLASVTVTNNTDEVNGDVSSAAALLASPGEDGISLREAIEATNKTPGADEIDFDFGHDGPEMIVLNGKELQISDHLTISGQSPDLLTIDANGESRVLRVEDGQVGLIDVTLNQLRIARGRADDGGAGSGDQNKGGGIFTLENTTLVSVSIEDNYAVSLGGGLYCRVERTEYLTKLTLSDTSIQGNTSVRSGGGIHNDCDAHVAGASIEANIGGAGGGISSRGFLTVIDSKLRGNAADSTLFLEIVGDAVGASLVGDRGGALLSTNIATITNSLVVANSAKEGGGIANLGSMEVSHTTLLKNSAEVGAGILHVDAYENGASLSLSNSISASNVTGGDIADEAGNLLSHGASIISDASLTGPNILNVDPLLDENGVPLPGSPAIDAGDTSLAVDAEGNPLKWDVRGEGFRRVLGYGVDIGAFEAAGFLPGDATEDGLVDLEDFSLLKGAFGGEAASHLDGDFNGDGLVDLTDFNILKESFGERLVAPDDAIAAAVAIDAALAGDDEE